MPTTLHDMQVADRSDDPPRYAVAGYKGVAFAFIRPDTETVPVEPCWDETLDDNGNPMDADVWWPPDGWRIVGADAVEAHEDTEDMQCDHCSDIIAEGTHLCTGTVQPGHGFNGQGAYAARCDTCRYMCAYWDDDDINPDIPWSDNFTHTPCYP